MTSDQSSEPSLLYHYTTAEGLKGILESKTIWATDAEFLNDAQELRYGRDELYEALIAEADRLAPESDDVTAEPEYSRGIVMRSAAAHLRPGGMYLAKQAHSVYVACFCENGDLLSQWRGYAAGGGYAIGLKRSGLERTGPISTAFKVVSPSGPVTKYADPPLEIRLLKVRYGAEAIGPTVRHALYEVAPQPSNHPGAKGWWRAQVLFKALAGIKHEAFREEREWRLLIVGSQGVESVMFRAGPPLGLVPYLAVPFEPSIVGEIVIGPGAYPEVRERGITRLIEQRGLSDVSLRHTSAPYRG